MASSRSHVLARSWLAMPFFFFGSNFPFSASQFSTTLRNAANIRGVAPVRTFDRSSCYTASRGQGTLFSIVQCWRPTSNRTCGGAWSGERLVRPTTTSCRTSPVFVCPQSLVLNAAVTFFQGFGWRGKSLRARAPEGRLPRWADCLWQ